MGFANPHDRFFKSFYSSVWCKVHLYLHLIKVCVDNITRSRFFLLVLFTSTFLSFFFSLPTIKSQVGWCEDTRLISFITLVSDVSENTPTPLLFSNNNNARRLRRRSSSCCVCPSFKAGSKDSANILPI